MKLQEEKAWSEVQDAGIPEFTKDNMRLVDWVDVKTPDWDLAFAEYEAGEKAKNELKDKQQEKEKKAEFDRINQRFEEEKKKLQ